jgi:hypothetical protein
MEYLGFKSKEKKNDKCKFYSFNDTIKRIYSKTERTSDRMPNEEELSPPVMTDKDIKINLRPEFMRLIEKIKEK